MIDLIPKIYDTPRAIRILGEEGTEEVVRVNEAFNHNGREITYKLGVGKYDVVVETGPSFATKRQEALQSMLELTKSYPQIAAVAGDLLVKNMDLPGATELAERIKKTLPPGLADDPKKQPIPPEAQAQLQQSGQLIEQLTQQLNEATKEIEQKKLELESKERIEFSKIAAQIEMKLADLGSKESLAMLSHQVNQISHRLQLVEFSEPIESDQNGAGSGRAMLPNEEQMNPGPPIPGDQGVM